MKKEDSKTKEEENNKLEDKN
jgi:hypothetical protein